MKANRTRLHRCMALLWAAAFCLSATAPAIADDAARDLPAVYAPASPLSVTIAIDAPPDTAVVGIEDAPPAGWTDVTSISDGGVYDAGNHKVKWPPFFDNLSRTVSYDVTPPGDAAGEQCFEGSVSFDGSSQFIIGDACVQPQSASPAARPNVVAWVAADGSIPVGGVCMTYADCCGGCGAPPCCEGRCIPAPDGSFPGTCYGPTNRYLGIAPNADNTMPTARRVSLQGGGAGPWWVSPPLLSFGIEVAEFQNTPHYTNTWPDELWVTGCSVVPDNTYEIQAIPAGADTADEGNYSDALELVTTTTWGDTVSTCFDNACYPADGTGGIDDILAAIAKFQGAANAPLAWLDIDPSSTDALPNQQVNIGDIFGSLDGFQGKEYPGDGPLGCVR